MSLTRHNSDARLFEKFKEQLFEQSNKSLACGDAPNDMCWPPIVNCSPSPSWKKQIKWGIHAPELIIYYKIPINREVCIFIFFDMSKSDPTSPRKSMNERCTRHICNKTAWEFRNYVTRRKMIKTCNNDMDAAKIWNKQYSLSIYTGNNCILIHH